MHQRYNPDRTSSRISAFSWHTAANLIYLTGGTTGKPRQISYTKERYDASILITKEILRVHGVGPGTRVAVCQPFDPWAIGPVFRDAALACGATVLPVGLLVSDPAFHQTFTSFNPDFVCGSASLLLSWHSDIYYLTDCSDKRRVIFHAGEPLRLSIRQACETAWNATLVNILGMAEFDSIASEGRTKGLLILSPHLDFGLGDVSGANMSRPLTCGSEGELLIREPNSEAWYRSRDLVRIIDQSPPDEPLWPGGWRIEHLGRNDHSIQLPDGSIIHSEQIESLLRGQPDFEFVQLHLSRTDRGTASLHLLGSPRPGILSPSPSQLRDAFLHSCFEVGDAVKHKAVDLKVSIVNTSQMERTSRGKLKMFVETECELT